MLNAATSVEELRAVAAPFLQRHGFGDDVELMILRGGANNRVYHVRDGNRQAVLKQYFQNPNDPRDRFRAEHAFYKFLWEQGVRRTPEPLGWDSELRLGLLGYIDGRKLAAAEVAGPVVREAVAFIVELNRENRAQSAKEIPLASEACFTLGEHVECVERRLSRLEAIEGSEQVDRDAAVFVANELKPAWSRIREGLDRSTNMALDGALPAKSRCLSPSDFGFHNALMNERGEIRFFDFEYAGWDDPAKLVCDFFCQPELPVGLEYWSSFVGPIASSLGQGDSLEGRARGLLPVYQIKWCCIMLNDFVGTGRARREFSLGDSGGTDRKVIQLEKTRKALAAVAVQPM